MSTQRKQLLVGFLLVCLSLTALTVANGCKKKSEPAVPAETGQKTQAVIEQTICPVMAGPINKDIYTEYKGKKVYFCCAACETQFEKDPEKYIPKLPQFKN